MAKTYQEINEKIKKGEAVVVTAEEIIDIVEENGTKKAAEKVDVVTTGTFGPMCSSGVFLNFGHSKPKMKIQKAWLNNVNAYAGLAAVDVYIGAAEMPEDDPLNRDHPGEFRYGGGHLIEDLIAGKDVKLTAIAYGTDCYPRKRIETWLNINDLNEAVLTNPRNAYQNYNVAVNLSSKTIYTYMGMLKANLGNANYSTAGQLSPLLNDPYLLTIGIGTRIFLGGAQGYVYWQGTQHSPGAQRNEKGIPIGGASTLAVVGDMKKMSIEWIRGTSMRGYGATLSVGIGIPIPILNEEIVKFTAVKNEDILQPIVDYSDTQSESLGLVDYRSLRSGKIMVKGKEVPTSSLSSYRKAREIANLSKEWIQRGDFLLAEFVQPLPDAETGLIAGSLKERPI